MRIQGIESSFTSGSLKPLFSARASHLQRTSGKESKNMVSSTRPTTKLHLRNPHLDPAGQSDHDRFPDHLGAGLLGRRSGPVCPTPAFRSSVPTTDERDTIEVFAEIPDRISHGCVKWSRHTGDGKGRSFTRNVRIDRRCKRISGRLREAV